MESISVPHLIEEVKKYPQLYDKSLDVDRDDKITCWKQIGEVLYPDWNTYSKGEQYEKVLELQRKWRSIRDQLNRELRQRKMPNRRRKVYKHFKKLMFLLNEEQLSLTQDDFGDHYDDEEECETRLEDSMEAMQESKPIRMLSQDYTEPIEKKYKIKSKKRTKLPPSPEPDSSELEAYDRHQPENESDKLFLLSFVDEMSKLPSSIKMWARTEIAKIMQIAVTKHFNDPLDVK